MTKLPSKIQDAIDNIQRVASPESIFLYGSRARQDFKEYSDYEFGALFKKEERWERARLAELHNISELNIYSFALEDFVQGKIDTPFPKKMFFREIVEVAQTITGKKIVENMTPPTITTLDLFESASFQTAYALAALRSHRAGDAVTSATEFTKSVFFGSRTLLMLNKQNFAVTYEQITEEILKLDLEAKFQTLIKHATAVRRGEGLDTKQLYVNITFQNQIVRREAERMLESNIRL